MKKIILGDLHFGIKKFDKDFFFNQIKFFDDVLFPYIKENNVEIIYQLGDFFDNRKIIDIEFLNLLDIHFFQKLKNLDIEFYTLIGNHDIYHKNRKDVNLLKYVKSIFKLDKFHIIENYEYIDNDLLIGWIIDEKELKNINFNKPKYVFGHFEINGFGMTKSEICHNGLPPSLFNEYENIEKVFSGHFHIRSEKGKILYVGTPYQLNFNDVGDEKGFYILENNDLRFIENNKTKRFIDIHYHNGKIEVIDINENIYESYDNVDIETLQGHEIRVFIDNDKDLSSNKFLEKLSKHNIDFTTIFNYIYDFENTNENTHKENMKDIETFLLDAIKNENIDLFEKTIAMLKELKNI